MHMMIKKDENGKKYIIATNTSKTNSLELNMQGVQKKVLNPLEVYISEL